MPALPRLQDVDQDPQAAAWSLAVERLRMGVLNHRIKAMDFPSRVLVG